MKLLKRYYVWLNSVGTSDGRSVAIEHLKLPFEVVPRRNESALKKDMLGRIEGCLSHEFVFRDDSRK